MSLKEVTNSQKTSASTTRPFVFSDSTWAGSGHMGAVSLSDMQRSWKNLRTSISQVMSFSMYGVSNVASEICGSIGALDTELCGRWAQLAAFLPMIRNYYNVTQVDPVSGKTVPNPPSEFYLLANDYNS